MPDLAHPDPLADVSDEAPERPEPGRPAPAPPVRPDAERLADAPATTCLNCGSVLPGEFCPDCGQRDQPIRQPAHVFIAESVSEYFGLDGRLWRSLGALLFKPGALTEAYLDGRRTRYLRPLRLYLSATVLFFFLLSLKDPFQVGYREIVLAPTPADALVAADDLDDRLERREEAAAATRDAIRSAAAALADLTVTGASARDSLLAQADAADSLRVWLDAAGDSLSARLRDGEPASWGPAGGDSLVTPAGLDPPLRPEVLAALADTGRVVSAEVTSAIASGLEEEVPDWMKGDLGRRMEASESPAERQMLIAQYQQAILRQVPASLFVMLPLFALLLKGFYLLGSGRRPRLGPRPVAARRATGWRVLADAGALLRWRTDRLRLRWRRWRRRRGHRLSLRRVRGAPRRLVRAARQSRALRPWRVRRVRLLRRSLRGARGRYYSEHLVFALHVHAFTFLALTPLLFVGLPMATAVAWEMWAGLALMLSIPVYFLVAQHRVYNESWRRTLAKSVVMGFLYLMLISGCTLLAAGLALRLG